MNKTDIMKKNDFIEIDFTAKIKDGEVFDSTLKKELEKLHIGHEHPINSKPFIFSLGNKMFLQSIDDFLIGKEIGKNYEIELAPEKAFGKRNPQLIKIIPLSAFKTQKYQPQVGMTFNFDGQIAKILSVSGGRIISDFNNPLAGKDVIYYISVKRKVVDIDEKVKSLIDFLFRKEFKFKINKTELEIILEESEKQYKQFIELFKDKFKEILNMNLTVYSPDSTKKPDKKIQSDK